MIKANCVTCGCTWNIDEDFAYLTDQEKDYIKAAGHFRAVCEDCDPDTEYEFVL